jgi:hypothetical protein
MRLFSLAAAVAMLSLCSVGAAQPLYGGLWLKPQSSAPTAPNGTQQGFWARSSTSDIATTAPLYVPGSITATGSAIAPSVRLSAAGSPAAAAVAPAADGDTGLLWPAANTVAVTAGGTQVATIVREGFSTAFTGGIANYPGGFGQATLSIANTSTRTGSGVAERTILRLEPSQGGALDNGNDDFPSDTVTFVELAPSVDQALTGGDEDGENSGATLAFNLARITGTFQDSLLRTVGFGDPENVSSTWRGLLIDPSVDYYGEAAVYGLVIDLMGTGGSANTWGVSIASPGRAISVTSGNTALKDTTIDGSLNVGIGPLYMGDAVTASTGIVLGADAAIYRSQADTLRTPDSWVVDKSMTVGERVITPPKSSSVASAGTQLSASQASLLGITTTGTATITLTSTPTIVAGSDGQRLVVFNAETSGGDIITLQDKGTLSGSGLDLGASSRALGPGDALTLCYSSALSCWIETGFSNN